MEFITGSLYSQIPYTGSGFLFKRSIVLCGVADFVCLFFIDELFYTGVYKSYFPFNCKKKIKLSFEK